MTREEAYKRIDAIIAKHEIDDDYVTLTSILDYDALRMTRKALEQEPKWIPVSERLPEFEDKVLCQCRAGIYEVLKFTSYGWYHDDAHCYMSGFVIAWMPLPEPYVPDTNIGKMSEIPTGEEVEE